MSDVFVDNEVDFRYVAERLVRHCSSSIGPNSGVESARAKSQPAPIHARAVREQTVLSAETNEWYV